MPLVRLQWADSRTSLETAYIFAPDRVLVTRDYQIHYFRLAEDQADPQGYAVYEEAPGTDGPSSKAPLVR